MKLSKNKVKILKKLKQVKIVESQNLQIILNKINLKFILKYNIQICLLPFLSLFFYLNTKVFQSQQQRKVQLLKKTIKTTPKKLKQSQSQFVIEIVQNQLGQLIFYQWIQVF
ncbi:unnamed protein product [Paramecium sonneborni]|uniref:Transmembrane protein n=1 Tax=Paramecium sonneborni TaxID=65129 RepID=A0A8S1R0Z6_9CILI|nr:unnamed protein product [Paramecium sonneborni]